MAITYDNPEVNAMGVSPIDRSRINGEITPRETLGNRLTQQQQVASSGKALVNPNAKIAERASYPSEAVNSERAWHQSKYDKSIDWEYNPTKSNDIGDLRAEAQGALGRLKDSTMNNVTILGTTLASDVISLTGGLLSSVIQGDISKMWDNNAVNAIGDFQRRRLEKNQIYRGQEFENKSFLGQLGSGIFWADLWQNAGYMEGMLIPGMAVGKLAQATKLLAKAPMLTKVGTNAIAAIGEASMEALNQKKDSEKDLYEKADMIYREKLANAQNWDEKNRIYDEYAKDLNQIEKDVVAIGNRTFAGNVALLTATGTVEFGDFVSRGYAESHKLLQQIMRNDVGKALSKGTFNAVMKGVGKTGLNFFSEGFEEYAQRSLSTGAANTIGANGFLEKYQDELNIELADNYLEAVGKSMYSDFFNKKAWIEFMSGALMGGIGIPGSHNGAYANISDAYKENKKMQELADKVNAFELENGISSKDLKNNGKAQLIFDALIRNAGINSLQNQSIMDRDKKGFVDARVQKVLNLAVLYDNIGEIDEFKKRLEWYSKIENDEQLQQLIEQTQEVEKDSEGNVTKEIKASPFKGMTRDEVNEKLKESNEFYKKIIDDFIEGKRSIDDASRGKLEEETIVRGAAAWAQKKNFQQRGNELYNDLNKNIQKYRESIVKKDDDSEDGKFINKFFDDITDLSENEIMYAFSSSKLISSIYAIGEYINRHTTSIDSEAINNIMQPIIDLSNIAKDYLEVNETVNEIQKNAEKENAKTKKILSKIKNIKKNYLVKKYGKNIQLLQDKEAIDNEIKKLPEEIRNDVLEYLKNNSNESMRKYFQEKEDLNKAMIAISNVLQTLDKEKFPVYRKELDETYGEETVDLVKSDIEEIVKNIGSLSELYEKLDVVVNTKKQSIDSIKDADEKIKFINDTKNYENFVSYIKNKINSYLNNNKKEESKKEKEKEEETKAASNSSTNKEEVKYDFPDYVINDVRQAIRNNKINDVKIILEGFEYQKKKDGGKISQDNVWINAKFGLEGKNGEGIIAPKSLDPDGEKNIQFMKDYLDGKINFGGNQTPENTQSTSSTSNTNDNNDDNNDNDDNVDNNDADEVVSADFTKDNKTPEDDLQRQEPQQAPTKSIMDIIFDKVNDYIESIKNKITFNELTHEYFIDGVKVDSSVTQYLDKINKREEIKDEYKFTRQIGLEADDLVRDYFSGVDVMSKSYPNYTEERKKEILESLKELKAKFDDKYKSGYRVISKPFPIAALIKSGDTKMSIAGTMDLLLIDGNGNIHIYDIKTKKRDYKNSTIDKHDYPQQLNAYRQIFSIVFPEYKDRIKDLGLVWFKTDYENPSDNNSYTVGTDKIIKAINGDKFTPIVDLDSYKTPKFYDIYGVEKKDVLSDVEQYKNVVYVPSNNNISSNVNAPHNMGVSKYSHEAAKEHRKVEYWNTPEANKSSAAYYIYQLLDAYGAYDFVDNGKLFDYLVFCGKNGIDKSSIIKYIRTRINGDETFLLAIEINDKNKKFFDNIGTKKLDINGTNYQLVGMLSHDQNKDSRVYKEFQKITDLIKAEKPDGIKENEYFVSKYTNGVSKINAGRLVYYTNDNKEISTTTLLEGLNNDDFEIGVYKPNGVLKIDSGVDIRKKHLVMPKDNGTNTSAGSAYLFVKCADGNYYPRQIRAKKISKSEIDDLDLNSDIYIKNIKELFKILCFSNEKDKKLSAKINLTRYIHLTNTKFKLSEFVLFDSEYKNGVKQNYIKLGNEKFFPEEMKTDGKTENDVVNELFDKIISDENIFLTPLVHVGGKNGGSSKLVSYEQMKERLRKSTLIHSNVMMRSIDCNFELFATNDKGEVSIEETETTDVAQYVNRIIVKKDYSFIAEQRNQINTLFNEYLPAGINTISDLYILHNDQNEFEIYLNNKLLDKTTNSDFYKIIKFIYESIREYKGVANIDISKLKDFYRYNEEYKILFKLANNSNNKYVIKVKNEAEAEYKEIKQMEKETMQAASPEPKPSTPEQLNDDSKANQQQNDSSQQQQQQTPINTDSKADSLIFGIAGFTPPQGGTNDNGAINVDDEISKMMSQTPEQNDAQSRNDACNNTTPPIDGVPF